MRAGLCWFVLSVLSISVLVLAAPASAAEVQVLARGADYYCPASLRITDSGELWVVDGFGSTFINMDPRTGKALEQFGGAMGSAALEVDNEGTIYWTAAFVGEVYKRTTDGQVTLLAALGTHTDGLELSPEEDRLFVSSLFEINALWEIDVNGVNPPRKVADVGGLDQFAFGPDGYLYAPDWLAGTGDILKINVDTGEVQVVTGGFANPVSVRFSPDQEMHVFDFVWNQILKVDLLTGEKTVVVNLGPGMDDFAFSPDGTIFIANMEDAFVGRIRRNGRTHYLTRPGLSNPGGISIRVNRCGREELLVSDGWTLRRYNARSGKLKETIYTTLDASDVFAPFSMYDDGTDLVMTNILFNMVQVWNPETRTSKALYPDLAGPVNAATFMGEVIVAQLATGDVVRVSDRQPLISGLAVPAGLAIDGDSLWVSDWATGCIWQAVANGTVLDNPVQLTCSLSNPEGLAIDLDGNLLVMETGAGRLSKVDRVTGTVSLIADGLALGLVAPGSPPPTWVAISSVAVSESGDLYCTGDVGNVIYRIRR